LYPACTMASAATSENPIGSWSIWRIAVLSPATDAAVRDLEVAVFLMRAMVRVFKLSGETKGLLSFRIVNERETKIGNIFFFFRSQNRKDHHLRDCP
jgi:hypothetical protein